jgi:hypothetical protein
MDMNVWFEWISTLPWWAHSSLLIVLLYIGLVLLARMGVLDSEQVKKYKAKCKEERKRQHEEEKKRQKEAAERKQEEEAKTRQQERTDFFERSWTKPEALLKIKEYRREIERRDRYGHRNKFYVPNLSYEEIQQRLDFLEILDFAPKRKEPNLSLADRRIACRKLHDNEREKELQELSNCFFDDEAARIQEVKRINNFWNDKTYKALQKIGEAERNDNVAA